jgi:hypothetical protein
VAHVAKKGSRARIGDVVRGKFNGCEMREMEYLSNNYYNSIAFLEPIMVKQ